MPRVDVGPNRQPDWQHWVITQRGIFRSEEPGLRLEDRHCAGTARGQGRAAAIRFAAEGTLIVAGDPLHEQALKTQRLVARAGGIALTPALLDAADEDSARGRVDEAVGAFRGIGILVAGVGAVSTQPYTDFACTLRAEVDSVRLAAHLAWPRLGRSRGSLVTVGSTADPTGSPSGRQTAHPVPRGGGRRAYPPTGRGGGPFAIRSHPLP